MKRKTLFIAAMAVLALGLAGQAGAFNIKKAFKHGVHDVEHGAEQAAGTVEHGAEEAAGAVVQGTEAALDGLEDAAKEAVKEMQKLPQSLEALTGSCEKALTKGLYPKDLIAALPKEAQMMNEAFGQGQCKAAQQSGFVCGIFPYLDDIVTSAATGGKITKNTVNDIGRAYDADPCKGMSNINDRLTCAVLGGLLRQDEKLGQCIEGVFSELLKAAQSIGKKLPGNFDPTPICTGAGEMAFGYALDAALDGAVTAEAIKRTINVVQNVQTALGIVGKAEDVVGKVSACKEFR